MKGSFRGEDVTLTQSHLSKNQKLNDSGENKEWIQKHGHTKEGFGEFNPLFLHLHTAVITFR